MVVLENLTKRYGDFTLDILSMEIHPGYITGLVGKNGAGKSTTIKSILGLVRPDSGVVKVFGTDAERLTSAEKKRIGVAMAEAGFSEYFTIKDIAKILKRMYIQFDSDKFIEACHKYGLPGDKIVKKFSTGMKAKLRVLVALSHGAELLILDEPTAGLDVEARQEILDLLRNYLVEHEGSSILITSHIATDLENLCDDIYMIDRGRVVLHEETDVILSDYAILKVDESEYDKLDKSYLLQVRKESYGYRCLTNERQFYIDNYPGVVVERSGIDELILAMAGGEN